MPTPPDCPRVSSKHTPSEVGTANSGQRTADGGQRTADGGQRATNGEPNTAHSAQRTADGEPNTAHSAQRTADGEPNTAHSAQRTADSGRRTAHSGQRTENSGEQRRAGDRTRRGSGRRTADSEQRTEDSGGSREAGYGTRRGSGRRTADSGQRGREGPNVEQVEVDAAEPSAAGCPRGRQHGAATSRNPLRRPPGSMRGVCRERLRHGGSGGPLRGTRSSPRRRLLLLSNPAAGAHRVPLRKRHGWRRGKLSRLPFRIAPRCRCGDGDSSL